MKRSLFILLLLITGAQGAVILDGDADVGIEWLRNGCLDEPDCRAELTRVLASEGYFFPEISIEYSRGDTIVSIDLGKPLTFNDLRLAGLDDTLMATISQEVDPRVPLSSDNLEQFLLMIARLYSNAGYPFAKIEIKSAQIHEEQLHLDLLLISGPRVNIGSIRYTGLRTTLPRTLNSRIKLRPGRGFREVDLQQASGALAQLSFCHLNGDPQVLFDGRSETAEITFPMQDSRNISFDGGLLLLPDNTLAGNVDVGLLNLLGGGRALDLSWSRRDKGSQNLQFDLLLPYFSGLPLDLKFQVAQEDRDSSFISTSITTGIAYRAGTHWSFGSEFGWEKVTPEEGYTTPSARVLTVALASGYDGRDNIYRTLGGAKLNYRFASSYRREFGAQDSVTSGYSTELSADLHYWQRLGDNLTLYSRLLAFQAGSDFDPIPLDQLISVGGAGNLRGYRESSFLARLGALTTLELRWYALDRLTLRIFADNGYIRTPEGDFGLTGFGAGMSVATSIGAVRFDLSLGEEKSLSSMLVHFGFEGEL